MMWKINYNLFVTMVDRSGQIKQYRNSDDGVMSKECNDVYGRNKLYIGCYFKSTLKIKTQSHADYCYYEFFI